MKTLFDAQRLQMTDAIRLTLESLVAYAAEVPDWVVAWSGGKDSTALVTFLAWATGLRRGPRAVKTKAAERPNTPGEDSARGREQRDRMDGGGAWVAPPG